MLIWATRLVIYIFYGILRRYRLVNVESVIFKYTSLFVLVRFLNTIGKKVEIKKVFID